MTDKNKNVIQHLDDCIQNFSLINKNRLTEPGIKSLIEIAKQMGSALAQNDENSFWVAYKLFNRIVTDFYDIPDGLKAHNGCIQSQTTISHDLSIISGS